MKYCPYCGAGLLKEDAAFCVECGKRLLVSPEATSENDQSVEKAGPAASKIAKDTDKKSKDKVSKKEKRKKKEKRSMPCVILEDLEYSGGGKRSNDGQKGSTGNQNTAPAPVAPTDSPTAEPQENYQMPGNFTGYESFGGGNNFFNL